jgi:hypothetical protein
MANKMSENEKLTPPKASTGDTAHLVTSGILSIIPGAPELFRKFVTPPLEKRQHAWMQAVANTLEKLESNKGLTLEDLNNNEAFVSVVLQATNVAIRNHHEEKRRLLASCVFNAGFTTDVETDLQLAFVRYIDELSPSHLVLLRAIRDRQNEIAPLKSYESIFELFKLNLENHPTRDVFKMMCLELQGRGLIRISQFIDDFSGMYEPSFIVNEQTRDDLPRVVISEVGNQFLDYISSN